MFDRLKFSKMQGYKENLNKHNVIKIASQSCLMKDVALAYMTEILLIKKHSSGSALNMFEEFTFLKDRKFGEYFGFTEKEVKKLCEQNERMDYEELESWYNG